uniref:Protein MIZU-KUSSEI 1 n=1 Tax=Leersia perrieri TaxID=77586 RepID=A0A0D9UZG4_9ORYZ
MTQPPRRPADTTTTTTTASFLGAASTPSPRPAPATPLPDVPPFLLNQHSTPQPPPLPPPTKQSSSKHHHRSRPARFVRSVRAAFRSFPILPAPSCRGLPSLPIPHLPGHHHGHGGGGGGRLRNHFHGATRTTGTLYGHRRSRITIAFHDSPGAPPALLLEIAVPTAKFIQDVSAAGMVRVTLECDKQQQHHPHHPPPAAERRLLDEPVWAAEVNGESVGYAARREATEADERVMRLLHATSMGAGVLPAADDHPTAADGEVTYMRAHFDRVVGSKDAETYYMHNPEGCATGPELTIFFIRT